MEIVDLSRELYHRTPSYPGHPPVMHGVWKSHEAVSYTHLTLPTIYSV